MKDFFLTFDTEDFISDNSIPLLDAILESLTNFDLRALFFITGHMAEKLSFYPNTVKLLSKHQIGYHTSAHSVHPTVFEFTDMADYEEAYRMSLLRETSHVNPLTGALEGSGGISLLRQLFPKNPVVSFRAPGHCWTPPHLEALKSLGILYDFSTNFSSDVVAYKGLTFYPYPVLSYWLGGFSEYLILLNSLRKSNTIVLTIHPSLIVNKVEWDSIYFKRNPLKLSKPLPRNPDQIAYLINRFNLLLKQLSGLQRIRLINVTPQLKKATSVLSPTMFIADNCFHQCMCWASRYGYEQKYLRKHFYKFFECM